MIRVEQGSRVILLRNGMEPYVPDVQQHFDLYYGTVTESEPGFVDFSEPRVHRYDFDRRLYMLPSLPEESPLVTDYFRHYRPCGTDLIFDLGAYAGVNTIYMARQVGEVIALEPDPVSRHCLRSNLELYGALNVPVLAEAVGDYVGTAMFNVDEAPGSALASGMRGPIRGSVEVGVTTIPELMIRYGVPRFIKMDIEGAEVEVLASCAATLAANKIMLAIDTHHQRDGAYTTNAVECILRDAGYQVESAANPFWTTWTTETP